MRLSHVIYVGYNRAEAERFEIGISGKPLEWRELLSGEQARNLPVKKCLFIADYLVRGKYTAWTVVPIKEHFFHFQKVVNCIKNMQLIQKKRGNWKYLGIYEQAIDDAIRESEHLLDVFGFDRNDIEEMNKWAKKELEEYGDIGDITYPECEFKITYQINHAVAKIYYNGIVIKNIVSIKDGEVQYSA